MKEEAPPANDRTYEPKATTTAIKAGEDPWSGPGEEIKDPSGEAAGEEKNESAKAATVPTWTSSKRRLASLV